MKTQQLSFDQLLEIGLILNDLPKNKKDLVMNKLIGLNDAVRDYENRIKNAINSLER